MECTSSRVVLPLSVPPLKLAASLALEAASLASLAAEQDENKMINKAMTTHTGRRMVVCLGDPRSTAPSFDTE